MLFEKHANNYGISIKRKEFSREILIFSILIDQYAIIAIMRESLVFRGRILLQMTFSGAALFLKCWAEDEVCIYVR